MQRHGYKEPCNEKVVNNIVDNKAVASLERRNNATHCVTGCFGGRRVPGQPVD